MTDEYAVDAAQIDAGRAMLAALEGVVGLVQLVRNRADCPTEIKQALTAHYRLDDAFAAIAQAKERRREEAKAIRRREEAKTIYRLVFEAGMTHSMSDARERRRGLEEAVRRARASASIRNGRTKSTKPSPSPPLPPDPHEEMARALEACITMIDDSLEGKVFDSGAYAAGITDVELKSDGGYMLSQARAALSKHRDHVEGGG